MHWFKKHLVFTVVFFIKYLICKKFQFVITIFIVKGRIFPMLIVNHTERVKIKEMISPVCVNLYINFNNAKIKLCLRSTINSQTVLSAFDLQVYLPSSVNRTPLKTSFLRRTWATCSTLRQNVNTYLYKSIIYIKVLYIPSRHICVILLIK